MLYVCMRGVMDVVFFCLYCDALVLVYGKYECFVMQMLYVCVFCFCFNIRRTLLGY